MHKTKIKKKKIIAIGMTIAALFIAIVIANAYSTPSDTNLTSDALKPALDDVGGDDYSTYLEDSIKRLNDRIEGIMKEWEDSVQGLRAARLKVTSPEQLAVKDRQIKQMQATIDQLNARVKTLENKTKTTPDAVVNQ